MKLYHWFKYRKALNFLAEKWMSANARTPHHMITGWAGVDTGELSYKWGKCEVMSEAEKYLLRPKTKQHVIKTFMRPAWNLTKKECEDMIMDFQLLQRRWEAAGQPKKDYTPYDWDIFI